MGVGPQSALANPTQELFEAGLAREVASQHQSVDEEADQALELAPAPVGDRCADEDVVTPGIAPEQHLPSGQQSHEEGRPALFGKNASRASCAPP